MTILENIMQNIYGNNDRSIQKEARDPNAALKALKADAALKLLESLMPGETTVIKGKVLDLRQGSILLQTTDGEKLNARTENLLPLSIGDTAEFVVSSSDGKTVMLKLAKHEDPKDAQLQKTVTRALESAGITRTERSENVTRELMLHSQPINEATIKKFLALSAKNPDVPVRDLILMDIAKIPVTKENIQIYKDFGNSEPVAEFAEAVAELAESLESIPESPAKNECVKELKNIITDMITGSISVTPSDTPESPAPLSVSNTDEPDASPDTEPNTVSDTEPDTTSDTELKTAPDTESKAAGNTSAPDGETAAKASSHPSRRLRGALHLPPGEFADPAKVKKLYEKLETAAEKLKKLEEKINSIKNGSQNNETDRQPQTHTAKLSSTLKFMDSVNDVFPYVQLPVKLKEENARGDLYVYEKKRAFKSGDTVSALLHLSLDNLGDTDILIKLTGQNAAVTVSAASDEAKDVFASEIPALTEALQKKGYSLNCEINVSENKEENAPLLTQFLEAHSPSLVNRYSFDMRA